ncbi:uncharacterized protein LOC127632168 isoform X4 [Xyrauchen texanus]|uniref:uncharacterized protein LOC127632168 isoform X4 n=1 Tax=Xyrauchen texanus TaxID=154827 RepID=UPI00224262C0|nr:uncharacterized protein LOC127632168 isoform X4 [Xyrauchen texanus]
MRVLCLLIFLCRASLYQSDFKHLTINCIAENDEHLENCNLTPPCIQNFSLTNCNITKCIKENENLPIKGELKCNVTPKVVDTTQSGSSVCEGFHTNTEGNNCDSQRPYLILFIFFAILSAGLLVYIVCIGKRKGCKTLNICENDQGRQHPAEPRNIWNEEVPLRE